MKLVLKISHLSLYIKVVLLLLVVASFLRMYRLGDVPHGMTWDEAAIGYNGYAVITARRDEWQTKLPVSFRSFGDYKAPLAIYTTGIFVTFLGSELVVVRLPFALAGILSVLGFILLAKELGGMFGLKKSEAETISLLSGFLLTLSPWHVHFSRVGFESGMALCLVIWGIWAALSGLNSKRKYQLWLWIIAASSLSLSFYAYHSSKIVAPLLLVLIGGYWFKKWLQQPIRILTASSVGILLTLPLAVDFIFGKGGERFSQTSILNSSDSWFQIARQVMNNFLIHLSPSFLIGGLTDTLRHGDGSWGVLYVTTFSFCLLAVLSLIWSLVRRSSTIATKLACFGILWVFIGLVPAAIGLDVPHSNRALLALPGFLILAGSGMLTLYTITQKLDEKLKLTGSHNEKNLLTKSIAGTFFLLHIFLFIAYQKNYYTSFAFSSSSDFNDGYLEMFSYIIPYEKGLEGHKKTDKLIVSNEYGQAYIYALFLRRTNPIWYQGGSLNTYLFTDHVNQSDVERPNTIVVATPKTVLQLEPQKTIYGSDGKPRFFIYVNE